MIWWLSLQSIILLVLWVLTDISRERWMKRALDAERRLYEPPVHIQLDGLYKRNVQ